MHVTPRREPSLYRPRPVSRAVHDQWLWGFVAGCALASGMSILAAFLLWPR